MSKAKKVAAAKVKRGVINKKKATDQVATDGIKPSVLLSGESPAPTVAATPPAPAHHAARREVAAAPHPSPPPAVAQSSPRKEIVEILRGDRFEERKFDAKDKTEELKP